MHLCAESSSPWCWRAGTGINILKDDVPHFDFTFHPGVVVSGALGYEFLENCFQGLMLELETAYRWNHIAKIKNDGLNTQIHGHIQSVALIANCIYQFPWSYAIKPFFGFGAGWGYEDISLSGPHLSGLHTHQCRPVAQIQGGFNALYIDCYEMSLRYTYLDFDRNVRAHSIFFSLLRRF